MADSATIVLNTGADRDKAIRWCSQIRDGTRVTFKAPRRSLDQNAKMWSMLTDISRQVKWHGYDLSPDDYKCLFTAGLRKAFVVPDLENTSFVMLGLRTSDMSVEEMSNMIELMFKFGAEHNVTWTDPNA
jgi:hypothetical protein